jgi:hypothetical protein
MATATVKAIVTVMVTAMAMGPANIITARVLARTKNIGD